MPMHKLAHAEIPTCTTLVHILEEVLSMVEGFFIPLPNPIMFQFKQMEVYAWFSARCCSNRDINSEDGKFERQ